MQPISAKSRATALVLGLFLGGFGGHRFYAGKIGSGVVMAILSLTFIGLVVTVVWTWVDIIRIAVGRFEDKSGALIKNW